MTALYSSSSVLLESRQEGMGQEMEERDLWQSSKSKHGTWTDIKNTVFALLECFDCCILLISSPVEV